MLNEYGDLRRLILRHARKAYRSQAHLDAWWQRLNYPANVDFNAALAEYDSFAQIISDHGAEIIWLDDDDRLTPDSIYVRDSAVASPDGLVLCQMGKPERQGEVECLRDDERLSIAGEITQPGLLEGGDLVWFDAGHLAVADAYRSNGAAAAQLVDLFDGAVDVGSIALPHYKGPGDVFHLMSIISPLDADLALVFSELMPVPFRNWLLEAGITLVEVPAAEFESMACNVFALAPRKCLMLAGNPETRRRLEAAGCEVVTYQGREISQKGCGGPTCLTRPLERD